MISGRRWHLQLRIKRAQGQRQNERYKAKGGSDSRAPRRDGENNRASGFVPMRKSPRGPQQKDQERRYAGPKIKKEQKREVSEREDLLSGRNPVMEALRAGRPLNRIYMASGLKDAVSNQIRSMAREARILIEEASREKLDMMTPGLHQGVVALTAPKDYVELDDILAKAKETGRPPLLIVLDEIEDPRNFGAILRTADAAGVDGVVIPQRRAVGLTETVAKSSAGAIEYVPVAKEVNIVRAIEQLKASGIWVAGIDMDGEKYHYETNLNIPLALVIGGEGKGIGRLVKEHCDFILKIPMLGHVSSLNASVAAAVVMYEVVRQKSTAQ
jgi:23S rRNA (guanosine2251-2'-O)-methyltransferase